MIDLKKPVSVRQFAKMVARPESSVRAARDRQSIVEGVNFDGKIIPEIAAREWGVEIIEEFGGKPLKKIIEKPVVVRSKPAPVKSVVDKPQKVKAVVSKPTPKLKIVTVKPKPSKSVKKEKPEATSFEDVVKQAMSEKLPNVTEEEIESLFDEIDPDDITKPEAERQAAIVKVKILRLSYEEKRGQMVPISKVNTVLFGYGQEIRTAVEGIPNRVLDKIMGASSRHDAKKYFEKEIYETLNLLADIQERKFE